MIPVEHAGKNFNLQLGNLQNYKQEFGNVLGTVYFNNQEVGSLGRVLKHIYSKPDNQVFNVPGSLVVAGANVVAVRVFTQEQKGPLSGWRSELAGPANQAARGARVAGARLRRNCPPPRPMRNPPDRFRQKSPLMMRLPSILFNGMLSPVVGYGIKGAVWYQGEGNADRAPAYGKLLSALIADWRGMWKQGDFPFYIVQLANCFPPVANPGKSTWAVLREAAIENLAERFPAQAWPSPSTWVMPLTFTITTRRRWDIASRSPPWPGPMDSRSGFPGRSTIPWRSRDVQIRLKFTHVGGGLVAKDGSLKHFAIAGADQNFVWADAVIDGDTVWSRARKSRNRSPSVTPGLTIPRVATSITRTICPPPLSAPTIGLFPG